MHASDEQQLWNQFLEGDQSAFRIIMNRHYKTLYNYSMKFSNDSELMKDCIQDLFMGLWERREHLTGQLNVKPYLLASLRRIVHRKLKITKRLPTEYLSTGMEEASNFDFSIEEKIVWGENEIKQKNQLNKLLAGLPPRQKEVIYLRFFQNLSRKEIAETMQISQQTVSNLLQISITRLKSDWKKLFVTALLLVAASIF